MFAQGIDALLVLGPGQYNPPMVYLTGIAHLTDAVLLKKRGQPPILFHRSMERDEAAATGLQTCDMEVNYGYNARLRKLAVQPGGDVPFFAAARLAQILIDQELAAARLAVYGQMDAGASLALLSALQEMLPSLALVGEWDNSLLRMAMSTKDAGEVERIRRMGQITTAVVGQVAEYLTAQRVQDQTLVKADGRPFTVGDVKRRINLWLAEQGADNPRGTIFAIGRDAGVPHSSGNPSDWLRLGQTIVFDIYPCEAGGGYYYDMTRTWCLGYAPDEALALYEDVLAAYHLVRGELRPGDTLSLYQEHVCSLFEGRGHPTLRQNPVTENGYVHGLGHGVGLYLHQEPFFRLAAPSTAVPEAVLEAVLEAGVPSSQRLAEGAVVTVEPGLYYPERGLGVRLEDTFWVSGPGPAAPLADYPLDLVLPVK